MENLRKNILQELERQEKNALAEYSKTNPWAKISIKMLYDFAKAGKLIRGFLLLETYLLLSKNNSPLPLPLASAIELIHSGLLIHDDIMDQDFLRRGKKTIPAVMMEQKIPLHSANSIAMCIGDIAFFNAMEIASQYSSKIQHFLSSEIVKVGIGQLQDIYPKDSVNTKSILETYRLKTGRYTFSLPLVLGAVLSDVDKETITKLDEIGEIMGVVYQIEDDYLGMFGENIGKEIGSDIKENKNTLYKFFIENHKDKKAKEILKYFGKKISQDNIAEIKKVVTELGIDVEIQEIKKTYIQSARKKILKLHISAAQKKCLTSLLEEHIGRFK